MKHDQTDRSAWLAAIGSYLLWGGMPLFWRLFEGTPAFVVFIHRCVWSFPFLILLGLIASRQSKDLMAVDRGRLPWLCLSGFLIGANWWIYIYGVSRHQVVEMSLGYFFAPLLTAALGVLVLRERLTLGQWAGVAMVTAGVVLYGWNIGHAPWLALGLAVTFSGYSLVRKMVKAAPLSALTTESLFLFVVAIIYLLTSGSDAELGEAWRSHSGLLVLSGSLTALPLLWFAVAVRGLSLTTLGMLNYISPTGKFIIATLIFGELVSAQQVWSFGVLWSGILLYMMFTYRRSRVILQPE
jgi:chloramphenicol-sensitive protein RarD